jgi:hypothetical protein
MIYYKTQFEGRDEVYCISIRSTADYINKIIKEDKIMSFPVSNHIVATWTCNNKKSSKYDFVSVTKIVHNNMSYGGREWESKKIPYSYFIN